MADSKNVYEIGLAMAGAISAGAYSAGVVDFLFQALHEWELAKRDDPDTVPNHSVCVRAAAGASAGSITAALAAVAVAGGLRPEKVAGAGAGEAAVQMRAACPLQGLGDLARHGIAGLTLNDLLANNDLEGRGRSRSRSSTRGILTTLTGEALAPAGSARWDRASPRLPAALRCPIWPSVCTSI